MSLRTRLVAMGAVLPALLLVAAILVTGALFSRRLLDAVDEGMRTQAAVEAVSMFDGLEPTPHVHLVRSPIADVASRSASAIAVYDRDGHRVAEHPSADLVPARVEPVAYTTPRFATESAADGRRRVLTFAVRSPAGTDYTVWLGHSLASHDEALSLFYGAAFSVIALVAAFLFGVQLIHARRLHERIERLVTHMNRLRAGDLDTPSPPDTGDDEIGLLHRSASDATDRLRAARRAQERLVADAAHELRTPLATMRAAIDVTLRRERDAEELRDSLTQVRGEVDRLTQLSKALLELAALRATEPEHAIVDLGDVARESIEHVRPIAEARGLELRLHVEGESAARGSARELRQAVDNLVSNALAHAPDGSVVSLSLRSSETTVRLVVSDRGPGVAVDERDAIFEPFHRGRARREGGTGLGLAIVRDIATRHGGQAFVDDVTGDTPTGAAIGFVIAR